MVVKMSGKCEVTKSEEKQSFILQFTGNWFIDVGILGFVNFMEEVYGWDLNELQAIVSNDSPRLFYGFFPIGYLFYHSTIRSIYKEIQNINNELFKENGLNQKIMEIEKEIKDLQDKITKTNDEREKKKLENKLSKLEEKKRAKLHEKDKMLKNIDALRKKLVEEKRKFKEDVIGVRDFFNLKETDIKGLLPNFRLNLPAIARNFCIFNSKEIRNDAFLAFRYLQLLCQENYEELYNFIKEKLPKTKKAKEGLSYEIYPDSTVNPFLYSPSEFSNIGYTKPLKTMEIKKSLGINLPIFVSLLCFEHAFENYYEKNVVRNICFYTNNLDVCYSINKRMRIKKEIALNKSKQQSLLKITFESVIDELVESKANFSLENMYLIEYEDIQNQKLINVEYIGVPKLQASILLDDVIRENLNNSIQFRSTKFKGNQYCWLLEEFIKGKPLYPIIFNYINLVLNEEINLTPYRYLYSLYSLIIDANMLDFKSKNKKWCLFSSDYFDNYKSLINKMKKDARFTSFSASLISQISEDIDKKRRIARELFGALKKKNKNIFLNILLKYMNEEKKLCSNENLNGWIFDKIIKNDTSYEMYGLVLIMNLLR
jgi:CRISPR-associated protein Cst1